METSDRSEGITLPDPNSGSDSISLLNNESNTSHQYSTRSKGRTEELESALALKQKAHNVIVHPRLKPIPYKESDLYIDNRSLNKTHICTNLDKDFYQYDDHPFNKRGFKYRPCRPNPLFTSNYYSTTELAPFTVSPSIFDRSQGILFSEDSKLVTTTQGWRSVRSNVGIREGKYYMEFNIINANNDNDKSHVRIGIARREASLEAPVGFDGYGYGLRDIKGQKITLSRPKEFMGDDGFKSGDTIGFLVELPLLEEHKSAVQSFLELKKLEAQSIKSEDADELATKKKRRVKKQLSETEEEKENLLIHGNILRDQIPIKYKNSLYYEQYEYTSTKKMDHLLNPVTVFGETAVLEDTIHKEAENLPTIPNSSIKVFKNGKEVGTMFENLYSFLPTNIESKNFNISYNTRQLQNSNYKNTDDGTLGYYLMISVFQGGIVGLNPGPDFKYPIEGEDGVRPLQESYEEAVIEEWLWDIIDEVESEYLDSFEA